jgi:tetratricopeptide (TPR) repeat protein
MTSVRKPRLGFALLLTAVMASVLMAGAQSDREPRQNPSGSAPDGSPPQQPPPKPRIQPPPPPSPEDVAAWERLWGGAGALPPANSTAPTSGPPAAPPSPPVAKPAERSRFDDLYGTYASGDVGVIGREFRTSADFERYRPELVRTLARWRAEWSRGHAAFALDIALTAFAQRWPDPGRFLAAARDIVISRPDAFGTRPDDDEFERRFHRAAVAVLSLLNAPRDVEAYLDSLESRLATTREGLAAGRPVDARLVLARGTARELLTMPAVLASANPNDNARRTWITRDDDDEARRRLRAALDTLALAAEYDDTRAEASVRRAFVEHRLGDHAEALRTLDALRTAGDRTVETWRALIRGRVLSALERHAEAGAAYERALDLAPETQTAALALAALRLRTGDRQGALSAAAKARSMPEAIADPWPTYWTGDSRWLPSWLTELRRSAS